MPFRAVGPRAELLALRNSGWRTDPSPQSLGASVVRFRDPICHGHPLPPFPAYVEPLKPTGPAPVGFAVRPGFRWTDRPRVRIPISPGTSLYGTGEQAGPLLRNGRRAMMWTSDSFGYDERTPSVYQSQPWILAVRPNGTAFGVIVESTWRVKLDLCATDPGAILVECEGPSPAVTIIDGASAEEVLGVLARLTGTMPMPPLWALGYQQCRWSYEPESRVREIAKGFREHRIPCDVIWLDIDYMKAFRCFTVDQSKFPDMKAMTADLRREGFRTVAMIDPGLSAEADYFAYTSGREGGHFVRVVGTEQKPTAVVTNQARALLGLPPVEDTRDGELSEGGTREYRGAVWPGPCAFPDFTRARTRRWWAAFYKEFMALGFGGVWNDMNEPAVFDGPGKSMPNAVMHEADEELGGPGPHAKYHNVYGMQMVRASREGIAAANPDKRPFVLTRSNFLGGHRYAATWTGDNIANQSHFRWSVSMVLNLGLSGQPFVGPDIGGFADTTSPELFARWMGVGALLPFARAHKIKEWAGKPVADHEPWSFGEPWTGLCRRAIERRYRLLPYFYTLFEEASRTGLPVCRPAFWADPRDARLRSADGMFLIGSDVLVVCDFNATGDPHPEQPPVPAEFVRMGSVDEGEAMLPRLYQRRGSVVPLAPLMQHTGEKPWDPLTLSTAAGADGRAKGTMYMDAGDGHEHVRGQFVRLGFEVDASDKVVTTREGAFAFGPKVTVERVG